MGGRRARSLTEIVGSGLTAQRGKFAKAMSDEDPGAVAVSSAELLAKSKKTVDILFYAARLAGFVKKQVQEGKDLSYEERVALARREWSRIKKKENLEDDPIITNAIVSAVVSAIGKGRK